MKNAQVDLAALRQAAGMTVLTAAELMGVSRRTWQRWEASGRLPYAALRRFEKLCRSTKPKGESDG